MSQTIDITKRTIIKNTRALKLNSTHSAEFSREALDAFELIGPAKNPDLKKLWQESKRALVLQKMHAPRTFKEVPAFTKSLEEFESYVNQQHRGVDEYKNDVLGGKYIIICLPRAVLTFNAETYELI